MDFANLSVPISVQTAGRFIDNQTGALEHTLRMVRDTVEWAIRGENVVKVYGREDRQSGDKFKDVRKIAGKFNSYHRSKNNSHGSLWEIPDIIGFTVVVSYPSDIARISRIIDELISTGPFRADKVRGVHRDDRGKASINIDPEFGRVLADRGYFACHYNVREKHYEEFTPICEIQVKTAMHDAWGVKTHDLVYKNPAPFDLNLLKSFESLGDVLSQLDLQSDLLRNSLANVSRVRTAKKSAINKLVMEEMFEAVMNSIEKKGAGPRIREELQRISIETPKSDVLSLETKIMALTDKMSNTYTFDNYAPFAAHFFLARNAKDRRSKRKAERGMAIWVDKIQDPFEQSFALANAALFKFFNDDRLAAIEETESALAAYDLVPPPSQKSKEFERYWRRGNSIHISLAYYYAEMIGTHDGTISEARGHADAHLKRSLDARARISSCPNNALVSDDELRACVDPQSVTQSIEKGYAAAGATIDQETLTEKAETEVESNFNTIDCELFVRTQLADRVELVEEVRRKLNVLHEKPPASIASLAASLFQFHDYCIRQRLAELE